MLYVIQIIYSQRRFNYYNSIRTHDLSSSNHFFMLFVVFECLPEFENGFEFRGFTNQ